MHAVTVFDLEFTAWENSMKERWLAPGEFREVVQIGAVRIDPHTFEAHGELNLLVKPRFNPVLSDYLVKLTGVTNAAIAERGMDFREACEKFIAFADGGPICAFGRDDNVLRENLALYAIHDAPAVPRHINVIPWLAANGIDMKDLHACDVARMCGARFDGREHDALEDARSVALGIQTLVSRGAKNPLLP
jgi:inhibitor of KinA sporulation pathway (predicted exonuclease)